MMTLHLSPRAAIVVELALRVRRQNREPAVNFDSLEQIVNLGVGVVVVVVDIDWFSLLAITGL